MAVQGGFGVDWTITVGTVAGTSVANVKEISFPVIANKLADITAHDSASGYTEQLATGRKEPAQFEATLTWDVAETTHAQLVTLAGSGASNAMTIEDTGSAETLSFSGIVVSIERMSDMDDALLAKVTVAVTGAITIT